MDVETISESFLKVLSHLCDKVMERVNSILTLEAQYFQ